MENKINTHADICTQLTALYERKNHDYGDSFGKGFAEYGMTMPIIRLEDKLNRVKALLRSPARVNDESVDDTLMDLANYAIMTLVERGSRSCSNCEHVGKDMAEPPCDTCQKGGGKTDNWEAKKV